MIPIARPDIGPDEVAAVTDVLHSGMLAAGRRVAELEDRFAEFIGVKHAIAVSNGTVALMCIFKGLGLGRGVEVITVEPDGPAAVAGVRPEDLIVSVGGQPVAAMDDLLQLMPGEAVGVPVQVGVVRAGQRLELELVPAELAG